MSTLFNEYIALRISYDGTTSHNHEIGRSNNPLSPEKFDAYDIRGRRIALENATFRHGRANGVQIKRSGRDASIGLLSMRNN
jgi:hypothetical protein